MVEWNKGFCENFELCKYLHIEIEACRYATYCSRSNCRFWHNTFGKFPFLENRHLNTRSFWSIENKQDEVKIEIEIKA